MWPGLVGQVKVLSRHESSQRRAALFPQDGTPPSTAVPPLTDVEVVIVKDRWVSPSVGFYFVFFVGERVLLGWTFSGI